MVGNGLSPEQRKAIEAELAEHAAYRALLAAADLVDGWAKSYPADIFIEPPPGQHGQTVDACSASALRAVLPEIAKEIRAMVPAVAQDYLALLAAAEQASAEVVRCLNPALASSDDYKKARWQADNAWYDVRAYVEGAAYERARQASGPGVS